MDNAEFIIYQRISLLHGLSRNHSIFLFLATKREVKNIKTLNYHFWNDTKGKEYNSLHAINRSVDNATYREGARG